MRATLTPTMRAAVSWSRIATRSRPVGERTRRQAANVRSETTTSETA